METIWTNYFDEEIEERVMELLKSGKAVRVESSCIGHTRAAMVEYGAKKFFEKVGATITVTDKHGNVYYQLDEEKVSKHD